VEDDRLYVFDGDLFTSAGIAAGIDMALALVERHVGPEISAKVARELVAPVRRSGDERQASAHLLYREHLQPGVHRVQDLIAKDPGARVSLGAMARRARMSERNLARRFREATGLSVKEYQTKLRLELCAKLLARGALSLDEVAARCGYADARQLRRLWRRAHGTTLKDARHPSS
jgi:transcriptional regulator GlxA family with amidase domain